TPLPLPVLFPYTTLFRSNGVFDELGYIAVLPFGEIAKLLFDNAGKVNSHKEILNCHQHGFNLDLPGHQSRVTGSDLYKRLIQRSDRKSTRLNSSHQIISY